MPAVAAVHGTVCVLSVSRVCRLPPPLPPSSPPPRVWDVAQLAIEVEALKDKVAQLEVRNAQLEARNACAGSTLSADGTCSVIPDAPNVTAMLVCSTPECDGAHLRVGD